MMKIAIEAQRIFRKKKHGMDIVALELIRHLQQIDRVNEYFIFVKQDEDNKVIEETDNFHIIEMPAVPYPVWEQHYLPRAIAKLAPDILHCTSNTAPVKVNVPVVLTLHDILYMDKIDLTKGSWYQRLGNLYRRWIVSRIIHQCEKIVTVSGFEKEQIDQHFSLPAGRVKTVYNALSTSFRQISDPAGVEGYRKKYHLPEQYVLYLGNTHPNKNMRNVLKAMSLLHHQHKNPLPLVMPDTDKKFLDKILQEINDPGLEAHIHLTGYIPNHELVYVYNMASLFLYPSFYESFGIPMLEAMACGIPVIASDRTGMPEVAGGAASLINPEDAAEIASAMQRLLTDDDLYAQYKNAGLRRAASFNWSTTAQQMLEVYEEVYYQNSAVYA